jgi:hypothetical protein
MALIAKRIATGQDVDIASLRNQSRRTPSASASTDNLTPTLYGTSHEVWSSEDDGINWKKWGERVARGKSFLEEGRQLLSTRVRSLQIFISKPAQPHCRPHGTQSWKKPLPSAVWKPRVHTHTVWYYFRTSYLTLNVLD